MEEGNCGVDMTGLVPEIKEYIVCVSAQIISQIKDEVKNKMLSVMIDIATKNNKLIGISIQYILNGAIVVRSIGMIEMKHSHTAEYILKLLKQCLQIYDISTNNVISITSDNASNMISLVNKFNDDVLEAG